MADENSLLLQKLAAYYGFELKVIDIKTPRTYAMFKCPNQKSHRGNSIEDAGDNARFIALFHKNDHVIISSEAQTSKALALEKLLYLFGIEGSIEYRELNYSHAAAHKMFSDYIDIKNPSVLEIKLAIRGK